MIATFPEQREAKRQALLDAVESLREIFLAGADEAEATGTLPQATVDAIYESGLFSFKTPQVLGGAEADPMIQLDVIEAASRIEPSAGWCVMIGAGSLANLSAFLCDEAIDEIFVGGTVRVRPAAAGDRRGHCRPTAGRPRHRASVGRGGQKFPAGVPSFNSASRRTA